MQQRSFQLNPFVFPAETRTRLKLLIIAVCLLSIQIGFVLADRLGLPSPSRIGSLVTAASAMPSPGTAELPGGELIYRAFLGTNIGLLGQLLLVLALPLLLCGLMLALAWLLYLLHPRFIAAGALAAASTEDGSAQLQHAVEDLSGKVALRLAPRVQLTEGRRDGNMRIFGFPGRYQLRIGGGWRIERLARPERFRAVLLHELAHVMNGDIAVAYFSRALALSFLVVVVAPTLAVVGLSALLQASRLGVNPTALLEFAIALIQGAATLAVLAALRASLLRVRELYADWRVVLWGEGEPLRILLAEQAATQGRRSWWRQAWSFHPTLAERSQTIQQPARLFTVAHDLAFFVGFLFALLIASLPTLLQLLGVILLTVIQIWQVAALADPNEASLLVRSAAFAIPLLVLALVVALAALVGAVGFLLTETLGSMCSGRRSPILPSSRAALRPYVCLVWPSSQR